MTTWRCEGKNEGWGRSSGNWSRAGAGHTTGVARGRTGVGRSSRWKPAIVKGDGTGAVAVVRGTGCRRVESIQKMRGGWLFDDDCRVRVRTIHIEDNITVLLMLSQC